MTTQEQKKEILKAKRYAKKEAKRVVREAYKEKVAASNEKKAAKSKAYNKANKSKKYKQNQAYKRDNTLPYNVVYCIPLYNGKDNYCGVTNQPSLRMYKHKALGKLNVNEWYELGRCNDKKEALALERAFHKLGYHGGIKETRARNAA